MRRRVKSCTMLPSSATARRVCHMAKWSLGSRQLPAAEVGLEAEGPPLTTMAGDLTTSAATAALSSSTTLVNGNWSRWSSR